MGCQARGKSSVAYARMKGVSEVGQSLRSDRNHFRVTVHGSGDGKTLDQLLLEMSDLIAETMTKASKRYVVKENNDNLVDIVNNQRDAAVFE
ncbi:hypothetical protein [Alicyclobacillus sp. SP_1]|uniref:hypothetical protein n=1 Tax=Alicyclobacillus sp. SP_1 TaxID=2942475 RepID=UPI002157E050|nr:hypothetical protein [Alicyclobacillus sp. SP_1]